MYTTKKINNDKHIQNNDLNKNEIHEYTNLQKYEEIDSNIKKNKLPLKNNHTYSGYNSNASNTVIEINNANTLRKDSSNSNTVFESSGVNDDLEIVETDLDKFPIKSTNKIYNKFEINKNSNYFDIYEKDQFYLKTDFKKISDINLENNKIEINVKSNIRPGTINSHRANPSIFSIDSKNAFVKNLKQGPSPEEESCNGGYTDRTLVKKNSNQSKDNKFQNDNSYKLYESVTSFPLNQSSQEDLHQFLTTPVPIGKNLLCNIVRKIKPKEAENNLKDKSYPKYYVFLADNNRLIMAACNESGHNAILMSSNYEVFDKESKFYLGRIKSNFFGTEFNIFNPGKKPEEVKKNDEVRINLGSINFEISFFGLRKPRKLDVYLPRLEQGGYKVVDSIDGFVSI